MNLKTTFLLLFSLFISSFLQAQKDTIPPVIEINADTNIQVLSAWFDMTTASDNQSDPASIKLTKTWGFNGPVSTISTRIFPVTYVATDSNGNTSTLKVTYVVGDYLAPQIDLNTPDTICHPYGTPYNSVQPTVSDNYYNKNQISLVKKSSTVNPNVKGIYEEVYEATDAAGNKTVKTRIVVVGDCNTSSLDYVEFPEINLYPNPAIDFLNVLIPFKSASGADIQIVGVDGVILYSSHLENGLSQIPSDQYANGLYFVVIKMNNETFNYTILIQNN